MSCHVLVLTNGAVAPVPAQRLKAAAPSPGVAAQLTAHAVRFVGEDSDGTMAGFRLEFPTKRDAEGTLEVVKKGQTLHVAGVRG